MKTGGFASSPQTIPCAGRNRIVGAVEPKRETAKRLRSDQRSILPLPRFTQIPSAIQQSRQSAEPTGLCLPNDAPPRFHLALQQSRQQTCGIPAALPRRPNDVATPRKESSSSGLSGPVWSPVRPEKYMPARARFQLVFRCGPVTAVAMKTVYVSKRDLVDASEGWVPWTMQPTRKYLPSIFRTRR